MLSVIAVVVTRNFALKVVIFVLFGKIVIVCILLNAVTYPEHLTLKFYNLQLLGPVY